MGLQLNEVRKGDEHETKSKIALKLKQYIENKYPKEYQQIHAHVMSLSARALVGVLFTPGLLDDEIEHIVKGKEKTYVGKSEVENEKECDNAGAKMGENEGKPNGGSPDK